MTLKKSRGVESTPGGVVHSESRFVWKFVFQIIFFPFVLILVLFGVKKFRDLWIPFRNLYQFIMEPKVTIFIIFLNVIIFFVSLFFSPDFFNSLVSYPQDLLNFRFHTLITSGFLHANLTHLLGNMLAIFIFGRVVEMNFGHFKTAKIYFGALIISGLFSSAINILLGNNVGGIGASGALMGLVAVAILVSPFYITYELLFPLPVMVIGWLTIYADITGLISPVNDGIGHLAHLGGYLSVMMLVYFFNSGERHKMKKGFLVNIVSLLIFLFVYFVFVV